MERLMDTILNVHEVQKELDKAARDAKHGSADVRAGRFVHRWAMDATLTASERGRTSSSRNRPARGDKEARSRSK